MAPFPALDGLGKALGFASILDTVDYVEKHLDYVTKDERAEARDFLYRGNKMFAPVGATEHEIEIDALRRVRQFDRR